MSFGCLIEWEAAALRHRKLAVGGQVEKLLGLSLEPILLALCEWGQHHAEELNEVNRLADCIIRPRQARQPAIA